MPAPEPQWSADLIRPLLEAWSDRLLAGVSRFDVLPDEVVDTRSVRCPPAAPAEIVAAEERLGVALPPAHRSFLEVSNGAHASSLGPETHDLEPPRHGFCTTTEIAWARDAVPITVDVWRDWPGLGEPARPDIPIERPGDIRDGSYSRIDDALCISVPYGSSADLLVPSPWSAEWELWGMRWGGAHEWSDFPEFLRTTAAAPLPDRSSEHADALAESGRLYELAEIDGPRAGRLALAQIRERGVDHQSMATMTLSALADPAFAPEMRELYREATNTLARKQLLLGLWRCADPEGLELLRDALDDPDERLAASLRELVEAYGDQGLTEPPPRAARRVS